MTCARCGSEYHNVSHCPWPLNASAAWLQILSPLIKWNLAAWSLSVRAAAMLP